MVMSQNFSYIKLKVNFVFYFCYFQYGIFSVLFDKILAIYMFLLKFLALREVPLKKYVEEVLRKTK